MYDYLTKTKTQVRNLAPALAAFIREHLAPIPPPVAKPPETVYHKPWKPTKGDMEPPF